MTKDMVQCPKDSKIMYQRDVCENVFRKGNIRCWCKTCELFRDEEQDTDNLQSEHFRKSVCLTIQMFFAGIGFYQRLSTMGAERGGDVMLIDTGLLWYI